MLLELAFARRTDLVLLQEPSFWCDRQNRWFTLQHPAYEAIYQSTTTTTRPRTAVYVRKRASLRYKLCKEVSADGDLLVLEVFGPIERFLVLNLYNERKLLEDLTLPRERTIKRALLPLQLQGKLFLLAGDFNSYHY